MKVLLINGSAHQKGNTFHALSMAAKTLAAQGIETEIMQIGNKPVRGCIACGVCKKKGNNRCTFDDDVCNRFLEKAADADGFIFGSPVYYGQPNGALLAVVQRMLMAGGSLMKDKPVANVAVCRQGGATATYQTMNMAFEMMNMPIVTSQYWNIVYGQKPVRLKTTKRVCRPCARWRTTWHGCSNVSTKVVTRNTLKERRGHP